MRSIRVRARLRAFAASQRNRPLEIVSYDVPGHDRARAVAIAHFVFGRTERAIVGGARKEYRYPGFLARDGVVWLGQSVFLLTPERSRELRDFLAAKGVAFERLVVRVE